MIGGAGPRGQADNPTKSNRGPGCQSDLLTSRRPPWPGYLPYGVGSPVAGATPMRTSAVPMGARHIAPVVRPSLDVATCPTCGRLSRMVFPHLGHLVCVRC